MRTAASVAVVIPLANESETFVKLATSLAGVMDSARTWRVYFVLDGASKDDTLQLSESLSRRDPRFKTIYEPANRHVVDAYVRGFRQAVQDGHQLIIEMDGGLSHDPAQIPAFVTAYEQGYDCIFGSRFMAGSQMKNDSMKRRFLSSTGTWLANMLLGTRLKDMTSGFEAFDSRVLGQLLKIKLRSRGHFFQTEIRYLCRNCRQVEVPISYHSPSPRVSNASIGNALSSLFHYFLKRISFNSPSLC